MRFPLEPSRDESRRLIEVARDLVLDFVDELPSSAAADLDSATEFAAGLRADPWPELPEDLDEIFQLVKAGAAKAFNTTGPGYMAFIPGGGLISAAVADFLACATNRFVNVWNAAPAFAEIEATVIRWLSQLFGFSADARGILTSGGSMANFSAIIAARHALLPENFLSGTAYVSDQAHLSVAKAALLAGFPRANVRTVPTTADMRMDVAALRTQIEEDREAGLIPFFVVASAGTTNTGAVDPIANVGEVARKFGLWFHIDAAYGGFFHLTQRGQGLFRGIERADSITLDPHKGMFLPYGTGCLLVREGHRLRDAHHIQADYLQDLAGEEDIPNFSEYSPELSRDFRGLRVWLPLKLHGARAFRAALDEKLDLAQQLYRGLREVPGLELPWIPELTVVPFRAAAVNGDSNAATRRLLAEINSSQRVFMSSTILDGSFTIRACILCHRTHEDRVAEAIEIIAKAAAATTG
ncbi:MAG: aspartate aminotransferase family protein [Actinomycetota bacterium]